MTRGEIFAALGKGITDLEGECLNPEAIPQVVARGALRAVAGAQVAFAEANPGGPLRCQVPDEKLLAAECGLVLLPGEAERVTGRVPVVRGVEVEDQARS